MPIKLHCNHCEKFMRNATSKDTGVEICPECADKIEGAFKDIEKITRRTVLQIQRISDKGKAELEMALRNVVKSDFDNSSVS